MDETKELVPEEELDVNPEALEQLSNNRGEDE
jgi:hypothetical protein